MCLVNPLFFEMLRVRTTEEVITEHLIIETSTDHPGSPHWDSAKLGEPYKGVASK